MELSGSAEAPTPETPVEEVPVEPESPAPVEPEVAAEVLYDLPDGRKVNADVLQKEWKENFLPEFTRKSQRLAEIESGKDVNKPSVEPWRSPDYVPKDYAEVIELAKQEAIREIQTSQQREQERLSSIQAAVNSEVQALKSIDPNLDENALFVHANKYGFGNLKAAHQNMMDMRAVTLEAEQRTIKNLKAREVDPVSSGASGGVPDDDGYDPSSMSQYQSAAEYLARVKGT